MTKIFNNRRDYENLHIFLWLMKDNAWSHEWHWVGMLMIVPTLAVQLHLTWQSRNDINEIFHSIAVALWIVANAIWMIGEFYFNDTLRPFSNIFFGAGLASMAFYYIVHFRKEVKVAKQSVEFSDTAPALDATPLT